MTITVWVSGVGAFYCELQTTSAVEALAFLKEHDHEGASSGVQIQYDGEEAYAELGRLR